MRWLTTMLLVFLISCQQEEPVHPELKLNLMEIPLGFPDIEFPEDNSYSEARWALGKRLFFDPAMSVDSSISCGSCHKPHLAFSDDLPTTPGVGNRPGTRNAPGLANVAYHPYFTREGGVPTLEMQVLVPIQEHNEFDYNIVLLATRLQEDSSYVNMAEEAYGQTINPYTITRSLACFERSLISGLSPYDQYQNYDDKQALSAAEKRGMDLFFSNRTACSECHSDFNFTNYAFENNGLYSVYQDEGRFRLTGEEEDRARFKVPSLRNVELTAPYMHDGSLENLEQVLEHYNSGGFDHINKSQFVQPLGLTDSEKSDIIQFLLSLTDEAFVANPIFSP